MRTILFIICVAIPATVFAGQEQIYNLNITLMPQKPGTIIKWDPNVYLDVDNCYGKMEHECHAHQHLSSIYNGPGYVGLNGWDWSVARPDTYSGYNFFGTHFSVRGEDFNTPNGWIDCSPEWVYADRANIHVYIYYDKQGNLAACNLEQRN